MKFEVKDPPREFNPYADMILKDCGEIKLEPNEQVTFTTADGRRNDFTAQSWGFYATNSINYRLVKEGFKTALVKSSAGSDEEPRLFIKLVKADRVDEFMEYLSRSESELECWLDEWFKNKAQKEVL